MSGAATATASTSMTTTNPAVPSGYWAASRQTERRARRGVVGGADRTVVPIDAQSYRTRGSTRVYTTSTIVLMTTKTSTDNSTAVCTIG